MLSAESPLDAGRTDSSERFVLGGYMDTDVSRYTSLVRFEPDKDIMRDCSQQLLSDCKFLRYLCKYLSEKATNNTSKFSRNESYPLKTRLAAFILDAPVSGIYREPHTEVAEYLGVTYRHLLYVLA